MQENRSFDHYFGTYPGVRGFDDRPEGKLGAFSQAWPGGRDSHLLPFRLDAQSGIGECTHDLTHNWLPQHLCRGKGDNSAFVVDAHHGPVRGARAGHRDDGLPHARATSRSITRWRTRSRSATTITARSSGPTHPNRLMSLSGTVDPTGSAGGPVLETNSDARRGVQRELGHDARGARGRRRELEGVQPGGDAVRAGVHRATRAVDRPTPSCPTSSSTRTRARRCTRRRSCRSYPTDFAGRHREGDAAGGELADPAGGVRRAPAGAAGAGRVVHEPGAADADVQPEGVGQDGGVPHATTRTTASSTTCRRRWPRRGRRAST